MSCGGKPIIIGSTPGRPRDLKGPAGPLTFAAPCPCGPPGMPKGQGALYRIGCIHCMGRPGAALCGGVFPRWPWRTSGAVLANFHIPAALHGLVPGRSGCSGGSIAAWAQPSPGDGAFPRWPWRTSGGSANRRRTQAQYQVHHHDDTKMNAVYAYRRRYLQQ